MMVPLPRRAWPTSMLVAALLASAAPAGAEPQAAGPPTEQSRRDAAREFAEGEKAFKAGDYRHAASLFESAYRLAPHPNPLWNAARAWQKAGDGPRAATLYARYLSEAPDDAPGRPSATTALADLSSKLTRVEISAQNVADVRVDNVPADGLVLYVEPGAHTFSARSDAGQVERSAQAAAGSTLTITLAPPAPSSTSTPTSTPTPTSTSTPTSTTAPGHGWSPWIVVAGGGLTLVGAVATIVSGIDTANFKSNHYDPDYARHDAQAVGQDLASGLDRERRTNILLGATVGVGVLTGVMALFFVDWHGSAAGPSVGVGAGPASLQVRGRF